MTRKAAIMSDVKIFTASSSATATPECAGHVLISGSYGGEYNAYNAAKLGVRAVILNDAGIGKNNAGTNGLPYLDLVDVAAATADAMTCHIADGDHMLEHGVISHVNESARKLGCAAGQSVRECAERMKSAPLRTAVLPPIKGGMRHPPTVTPGGRTVVYLDAAPMLQPSDAGMIVVTGSHAALFRGQPDNVVNVDVFAIFFSDAGVGKDDAGIKRLPELDKREIAAGTVAAMSAPIGHARAIHDVGILSHVNATAHKLGGRPGMPLREFVAVLVKA